MKNLDHLTQMKKLYKSAKWNYIISSELCIYSSKDTSKRCYCVCRELLLTQKLGSLCFASNRNCEHHMNGLMWMYFLEWNNTHCLPMVIMYHRRLMSWKINLIPFYYRLWMSFHMSWKVKVQSIRTHAMHGRRSVGTKSFSVSPSIVSVPVLTIQTASNCWLLALNVAVGHGLLHTMRKVRLFR